MHRFEKMMEKKKKDKPELNDVEKDAKTHVLKAMRDMAAGKMHEKLGNLKKVSVAAGDDQSLKAGLDKAKEIVDAHMEGHDSGLDQHEANEDPMEEMSETPQEEAHEVAMGEEHDEMHPGENEDMDEEAINAKLEHLMHLKRKMASKKA